MKLPDVSGVRLRRAGKGLALSSPPCCLPPMQKRQRPDCIFSELNTQPACTPVYASPCTSRCPTQNSGPSGSLLLPRRTLAFPASCRFIPAHRIGDHSLIERRRPLATKRTIGAADKGNGGSYFPRGWLKECGRPESLRSDNGPEYTCEVGSEGQMYLQTGCLFRELARACRAEAALHARARYGYVVQGWYFQESFKYPCEPVES